MRNLSQQELCRLRARDFKQAHPELIREMKPVLPAKATWHEIPVNEEGTVGAPRTIKDGDTVTAGNILKYELPGHGPGLYLALPQSDTTGEFTEDEVQTASDFMLYWEPEVTDSILAKTAVRGSL